jgi:hypothetical protein
MAKKLYNSLVSMFGRRGLNERDMLTWAKTEYANDWQWAYNYMLMTGGKTPPSYTVKGVTQ